MSLRGKIEISAVLIFVFGMLGMLTWGVSCEPGHCMEALRTWLMIWWSAAGVFALYFVWTKLKS